MNNGTGVGDRRGSNSRPPKYTFKVVEGGGITRFKACLERPQQGPVVCAICHSSLPGRSERQHYKHLKEKHNDVIIVRDDSGQQARGDEANAGMEVYEEDDNREDRQLEVEREPAGGTPEERYDNEDAPSDGATTPAFDGPTEGAANEGQADEQLLDDEDESGREDSASEHSSYVTDEEDLGEEEEDLLNMDEIAAAVAADAAVADAAAADAAAAASAAEANGADEATGDYYHGGSSLEERLNASIRRVLEAGGNGGDQGALSEYQKECLEEMCRAADLEGLGQHENGLDETEWDLRKVAEELSMPIDQDGSSTLSIGQYCVDMLMIMKVTT